MLGRVETRATPSGPVTIVVPVFDDWGSVARLLPALDGALGARGVEARVVLVDDASISPAPDDLCHERYQALDRVELLRLRRNLGHQRAIAVGLVHVHQHHSGTGAVVVMDGDGEDRPEDVPRLLDALARGSGEQVVFAARTRRMESLLFRLFYQLFRGLSRLLTGHPVRVGNFSVLTPAALHRLVVVSELWNHYAAAVFRSRIRFGAIPLARGERYDGRSQMRFAELVRHGLSSISVFGDLVGVRLLVATAGLMVLAALGVAGALALRISSDALLPGWATTATGIGVVVLMQALLLVLVLSFVILGARSQLDLVPLRDAPVFMDGVETLYPPA